MSRVLFVGIVLGALTACGADEDDPELKKADAQRACQEWVADRLKAPSTAEFVDVSTRTGQADFTEQDVYDGKVRDDVFTVRGSVDSENSFGAMIRTSWQCEVQDGGDSWHLLDLEIS